MSDEYDILTFEDEEGNKVDFQVIEQTMLAGTNYLLVADGDKDDSECFILKEVKDESNGTTVYEIVEDDTVLESLSRIFNELLDDMDLEV